MDRAFWIVLTVSALSATRAQAADDAICDTVAIEAAQETGVPLAILRAITRVETMTVRDGISGPWPWTINHAGHGEWFDTPQAALLRIEGLIGEGESLDIGCFQINTHWHGDAFASAAQMLDPAENARYAAEFLTELYAEAGDWKAAVAAYHSRDTDRGEGYAGRVAKVMRAMQGIPLPDLVASSPRVNRFPLMLAGNPSTNGSLFGATGLQAPLVGR